MARFILIVVLLLVAARFFWSLVELVLRGAIGAPAPNSGRGGVFSTGADVDAVNHAPIVAMRDSLKSAPPLPGGERAGVRGETWDVSPRDAPNDVGRVPPPPKPHPPGERGPAGKDSPPERQESALGVAASVSVPSGARKRKSVVPIAGAPHGSRGACAAASRCRAGRRPRSARGRCLIMRRR